MPSSFTFGGADPLAENVTKVSSSSYAIPGTGDYVFTGTSGGSWSLPSVSSGTRVSVKHQGTGTLSITGTMFDDQAIVSAEIDTGDAATFTSDGTYYNVS